MKKQGQEAKEKSHQGTHWKDIGSHWKSRTGAVKEELSEEVIGRHEKQRGTHRRRCINNVNGGVNMKYQRISEHIKAIRAENIRAE